MVEHVFNGDLDQTFPTKTLLGLEDEEKAEIFQLARRYKELCFYSGNPEYWAESIEGAHFSDLDLICMKLFDHYDFLLGLVRDGGEETLKLLKSFQKEPMVVGGSVIDFLRNTFENDDLLRDLLLEMSKENGNYRGLTNQQKEVLLTYPNHVLFEIIDGEDKILPPKETIERLQEAYFGRDVAEFSSFEALGNVLSDEEEFESAVLDVFCGTPEEYRFSHK